MKITNFKGKFEKIYEDTIYRFQSGGIMAGDIVKISANALSNAKVKGMTEAYQEMLKNAMESDLNIRVGGVKSIRPNTAGNYDATGTDAAGDFHVDIVVEYAPGLWRDPITVPLEILERFDTGINLAPVPDSLKRQNDIEPGAEIVTNDPDRTNAKVHTKLANTSEPKDGRDGLQKPKAYKESVELEDVYAQMITEDSNDNKYQLTFNEFQNFDELMPLMQKLYGDNIGFQMGPDAENKPGHEFQLSLGARYEDPEKMENQIAPAVDGSVVIEYLDYEGGLSDLRHGNPRYSYDADIAPEYEAEMMNTQP